MLKSALKNTWSVRNKLFSLRVLGESWESDRILQTAHKHERGLLFSFLLICIHFWSCKTLCIWLTLSLFPINSSFPFHEALLSILTPSWLCFSFLPVLLPVLNNFSLFSSAVIFPCSTVAVWLQEPGTKLAKRRAGGMSQAMENVPVVKEVILALEQGLHASGNWPVDDSQKSSKWS